MKHVLFVWLSLGVGLLGFFMASVVLVQIGSNTPEQIFVCLIAWAVVTLLGVLARATYFGD